MTECGSGSGDCPKNTKILERLAALEVFTKQTFSQINSNVALARELVEKDRKETRDYVAGKFEGFNQWQQRFDRLEGELVRRIDLDKEVNTARQFTDQALSIAKELTKLAEKTVNDRINGIGTRVDKTERMLYIGVGIVLAIQFLLHFFK